MPAVHNSESKASRSKDMPAGTTSALVPGGRNWDASLGFLMHDVSRLRRNVFDKYMRPGNITRSQWCVLTYLAHHDGMIQCELAGVLELGKSATGSLIDRLESVDLVCRRNDDSDRRVKRIYLTPAGTELVRNMGSRSQEISERILARLDDDSRYALAGMLERVKKNLLSIASSTAKKA